MSKRSETYNSLEAGQYLKAIVLKDVRGFGGPSRLDLMSVSGQPARWNVLLGANASGKSTLLSAISLALLHPKLRYSLSPEDLDYFVRSDKGGLIGRESTIDLELDDSTSSVLLRHHPYEPPDIKSNSFLLRSVFAAYSADRRWSSSTLKTIRSSRSGPQLLTSTENLIDAREWFAEHDFARKSKRSRYARLEFARVKRVLTQVLPEVTDVRTQISRRIRRWRGSSKISVQFCIFDKWLDFEDLSLGYQTFATWVVDFASRMLERYSDSPNPLSESAICIVDEIDLHMHPSWQRSVVENLTDIFPRTQFIVSAHSPVVVQSALAANLVLLKRVRDEIVIDNDPKVVHTWRLDQLLTSDLFGLTSARPPTVEKKLSRRTMLLQKARLTKREKEELARLDDLAASLPGTRDEAQIEARKILEEAAKRIGSTAFRKK